MTGIAHEWAAPPDDGHRGSETTPGEVLQAPTQGEDGRRHPALHRDPASPQTALGASGPWILVLVLVFLVGAGLAVIFS